MTLKEKVTSKLSEMRAVSSVIGVILMVAITVILAAVIGTFVMGLGNNVSENAQAGVSFDQNGTAVDIQLTSLGNVESGSDINVSYCDSTVKNFSGDVGQILTDDTCSSGDKITVVAKIDGKESVVATHRVN
jgi:flagellin-like protein